MKLTLMNTLTLTFFMSLGLGIVTNAEAKLKKGDAFPLVSLPSLSGNGSIDLSKYKGKVVIIDFWASWCEPCKVELPFLNKLAQKYKGKDLVVIGVNLDEKKSEAAAFLKSHPVQLPIAFDGEKKTLVEKAQVEVMPTSFIVDKNGVIADRHEAFRAGDEAKIEKLVSELMKK